MTKSLANPAAMDQAIVLNPENDKVTKCFLGMEESVLLK